MGDFRSPDLDAPLDWAAAMAVPPADAEVRGMFLQDTLEDLKRAGIKPSEARKSYVGFKSYPLREYMSLLKDAALGIYPTMSPRRALYEMGLQVYPRFASTLIGKTMFTFAGNDFGKIIQLASKAYEVSGNTGKVTIVDQKPGVAIAQLREVHNHLDSLQVGIWRGAMRAANVEGEVRVQIFGPSDADFELVWRDRSVRQGKSA
jgi:uncharacterized protein (TIGR02265 family)